MSAVVGTDDVAEFFFFVPGFWYSIALAWFDRHFVSFFFVFISINKFWKMPVRLTHGLYRMTFLMFGWSVCLFNVSEEQTATGVVMFLRFRKSKMCMPAFASGI